MRASYILCQESLCQGMGYQVICGFPKSCNIDTRDIPIAPKMTESVCVEEEY